MRTSLSRPERSPGRTPAGLSRPGAAAPGAAGGQHPVLGWQRAVGNQAVQRMLRPAAHLEIGAPGNDQEQAADRAATQALANPAHPAVPASGHTGVAGTPERPARRGPGSPSVPSPLPDVIQAGLRAGGQPLDPYTRRFMEARFDLDLGQVRVHSGSGANQSARALDAQAYTTGLHIVFAAGRYAPATLEGRRLIAHELAHVGQQGQRPSPGLIQRQLASGTPASGTPASVPSWTDLWDNFVFAQISLSPEKTTALAKELMKAPREPGDLLEHGGEVVAWLQRHGEFDSAASLLSDIRTSATVAWLLEDNLLPPNALFGVAAPQGDLIELGKQAARDGRHDDAFRFFGVAHEILSFHAYQRTAQRSAGDATRGEAYLSLNSIYGSMREIYGFYNVLEEEALAAGDAKAAERARLKGQELLAEIKASYSPSDEPVETVEATAVGSALDLEGSNSARTRLTALPGLTPPQDIGTGARTEPLTSVQAALAAQAALQAEVRREPAIRQAFGRAPVDFTDTKQRQQAWRIMYTSYKQAGPGALGNLMALIGRYNKAYTVHTAYNIRDFGPNYLDSTFPTDLASRIEQDCGVYALSVAWDVFQTLHHADAKLDVEFRLATSLDHVTLMIDDKSTAESYLVNNDAITRINQAVAPESRSVRPFFRPMPRPGDLTGTGTYDDQDPPAPPWVSSEDEVQKEYAELRGLPYLATPFFYRGLGSTRDSESAFHDGIWTRYLNATGEIASKIALLNAALKEKKQGNVHSLQKAFGDSAMLLDALMGQLAPFADDRDELSSHLASNMNTAVGTLLIFERFVKSFGPFDAGHRFSYHWPAGKPHPLVRTALAILRLRKLGGTITKDQQKFLTYVEKVFTGLAENRAAGEAGQF